MITKFLSNLNSLYRSVFREQNSVQNPVLYSFALSGLAIALALIYTSSSIQMPSPANKATSDQTLHEITPHNPLLISAQAPITTLNAVLGTDYVVVFDVSGSMDIETTCFDCWIEDPAKSADSMAYPFPSNGDFNPLDYRESNKVAGPFNIYWDGAAASHPLCDATDPITNPTGAPLPHVEGGYKYSIHEAEFYSREVPFHGWEFAKRVPGQGFWVVQRQNRGSNGTFVRAHPFVTYSQANLSNYPQLQGGAYNAECFSGPNLSGNCWETRANALGEAAPSSVPYVEYDFTVDWAEETANQTHIWIRALGGSNYADEWYGKSAIQLNHWKESIYWQVDTLDVEGGPFNGLNDLGWARTAISDNQWRWIKIANNLNLPNGQHTLKLYQGSSGFSVDKIIVTNRPDSSVGASRVSFFVGGATGPDATPGSATREACNICNPAFGKTVDTAQCSCRTAPGDTTVGDYAGGGGTGLGCSNVLTLTNTLNNDLFHDVDPLRSAQEAVKNFAARLDPKFDQIGIVPFSNVVKQQADRKRVKLECIRNADVNLGGTDQCFGITTGISYTNVVQGIEDQYEGSSTNIAEGIKEGLEELGISIPGYNENVGHECSPTINRDDKKSCDREGLFQRVLILMTDGSPNVNSGASCPSSFQWQGLIGGGGGNNAFDCALYYAAQAAEYGVMVHTIGLGPGVDGDLLHAMATGVDPYGGVVGDGNDVTYFQTCGGQYFHAANLTDLDAIFDTIKTISTTCRPPYHRYLPIILKTS